MSKTLGSAFVRDSLMGGGGSGLQSGFLGLPRDVSSADESTKGRRPLANTTSEDCRVWRSERSSSVEEHIKECLR